jgi:altronate dehydratase small subunit
MPDRYLVVVDPADNVATAIREVEAGETVEVERGDGGEVLSFEVDEDVPFGHKLAIVDVDEGETITKYGVSIGNATEDISAGEWVHVHNVESNYGRGDLAGGEGSAEAIHE